MRGLPRFLVLMSTLLFLMATHPRGAPTTRIDHPSEDSVDPYDSLRASLHGYRWPTEENLTITSSFADFRSTHFHGGIDISTRRQQGHRVFASRAGYVAHISVSPYGYGKLVILQHPDGYKTAYAHLSRFSDSLETYVERMQHSQDKYPIELDCEPGQFPVAQGDIIAYTGATGIGVAHLHFEILDEHYNQVNPLLVPDFAKYIRDTTPPVIRKIAFVPLDESSRIDDGLTTRTLNAVRTHGKDFRFTAIPRCTGTIGVEVYAMDHSNDTWYRSTATDIELYVDSTQVFASRIARILLPETKQVALHFDWRMYRKHRGYFQRLFVEPGDRQPFYTGSDGNLDGLHTQDFSEGRHTLRVVVNDLFGNSSSLEGTVIFNHPPHIEVTADSTTTVLRIPSSAPLRSVSVASLQGAHWKTHTYRGSTLDHSGNDYSFQIPTERHSILRIVAENIYGSRSLPSFVIPGRSVPHRVSLRLKKQLFDDYLTVIVKSGALLKNPPILSAVSEFGSRPIHLHQTDLQAYAGMYALSPSDEGTVRIEARLDTADEHPQVLGQFSVFPVTPEHGGIVRAGDGKFRVEFGPGGVYRPMFFRVEKTAEGYSVLPDDQLLAKGGVAEYTLSGTPSGKVGLFHRTDILDWTTPGEKSVLRGKIDRFAGNFSIIEDNAPPEISSLFVSYARGTVRVSFRLHDQISGIEPDSIRISVDNDVLIGEFDPYARTVRCTETHPLEPGKHIVTIFASDRMANTIVLRRSLTVTGRR
jgi:hypothetical protein